jgi:hypothetical protein
MPRFTGHWRLSFISMDAVPTARVMGLARGLDAKIYRTLETLFISMDAVPAARVMGLTRPRCQYLQDI